MFWFGFAGRKSEQVNDAHFEHSGKLFQSRYGRRIHTTLHQTDELHRTADPFRQPDLRQLPLPAQVGDPLAKFSLKHGVGLPLIAVEGNAAKLRASLRHKADGRGSREKWFRRN
jgi:hypothetical protein